MTAEIETKTPSTWKVKALVALTTAGGLVLPVAAEGMNLTSVTDIITDVTLIFPGLVEVVIAAVPIMVVIAIASFVITLLGGILQKMK